MPCGSAWPQIGPPHPGELAVEVPCAQQLLMAPASHLLYLISLTHNQSWGIQ